MSVEHGLSNCGTPTTIGMQTTVVGVLNPLNAELNPICHLLALLGAHLIFHVSRERVNITVIILILIFRRYERALPIFKSF